MLSPSRVQIHAPKNVHGHAVSRKKNIIAGAGDAMARALSKFGPFSPKGGRG